jgi:predicted ATPase
LSAVIMRIEQIRIKNFKVFKDVQVSDLPPMCVFLGVNGSGKTTFFDVFGFLSDALQNNVTVAVNRRGGFQELLSRGCNPQKDLIEIGMIIRGDYGSDILYEYIIKIGLLGEKIIVKEENVNVKGGVYLHPNILSSKEGSGNAIYQFYENDELITEDKSFDIDSSDMLALKPLSAFKGYLNLKFIYNSLTNPFIVDFDPKILQNSSGKTQESYLFSDGSNLAQVAKNAKEGSKFLLKEIVKKFADNTTIEEVDIVETDDKKITLRFKDQYFEESFLSGSVSDGTIKFFAYLLLLHEQYMRRFLLLEEPEKDFYPGLLPVLAEEIRQHAEREGQVFVSTHSPEFVDGVAVDELFYLVKQDGFTTIKAAADDPLVVQLSRDNSLGWLWRSNYLQITAQ